MRASIKKAGSTEVQRVTGGVYPGAFPSSLLQSQALGVHFLPEDHTFLRPGRFHIIQSLPSPCFALHLRGVGGKMALVQDLHSPFTLSWRVLGIHPGYYFSVSQSQIAISGCRQEHFNKLFSLVCFQKLLSIFLIAHLFRDSRSDWALLSFTQPPG